MPVPQELRDNRLVDGAFVGIRPVTLGMLLSGVWFIAEGALFVSGGEGMLGSTREWIFQCLEWR